MTAEEEAFSTIADMIYEAAFAPENWPSALQALCALSASASGSLLILNGDENPRFTGTGPVVDVLQRLAAGETWRKSYSVARIQEAPPPIFTYDADYFTPQMLEGDPLRRPMLRAHGLGGQSATLIPLLSGESVMITFEHGVDAGRPDPQTLERLNRFRPHLARAAIMATRLRLSAAETAARSFDDLDLPAAVVNRKGAVLAVSARLQGMPTLFGLMADGGLARDNPAAAALLARALDETTREGVVRSVPVMAPDGEDFGGVVVLHVLPLRRAAHEIFGSGDAMIVATFADPRRSAPAPAVLSNLFDLTAAEARLAAALARGLSVQEAAAACGVTFGSARVYLERIFRKTGVNRQAQLVAVLKSAQPFRPGD